MNSLSVLCCALLVVLARPNSAIAEGKASSSGRKEVSIAAVGDILFGRYRFATKKRRIVSKVASPFSDVAAILRGQDITFGNLESPVVEEPKTFSLTRNLTFRTDPKELGLLVDAGFDVISIANNHIFNFGTSGAPQSKANLEAAGLRSIGAGATVEEASKPTVFVKNGLTVGFVAFTVWTNNRASDVHGAVAFVNRWQLSANLRTKVREAKVRSNSDFLVVSLHWGIEGQAHPELVQIRAAKVAIDAGADLILGHHPHVVQDIQRYKHGVIAYSLGNFLFDNPHDNQRQSLIFTASLIKDENGKRVGDVLLHPVIISRKDRRPILTNNRKWRQTLRGLARGFKLVKPFIPSAEVRVAQGFGQ